jgi:hypothetical protein
MFDQRESPVLLMVGLAVGALTAAPVGAASRPAPRPAIGDLGAAPNVPGADAPLVVLYSQYDNPDTIAINSQNFEAAYDAYDDFAADDFVVPVGVKWSIMGIRLEGTYYDSPGPAASFNVSLHQGVGGLPKDPPKVTRSSLGYTFVPPSTFHIKVDPPINLPESGSRRHVWISLQANMDFAGGAGGQWGWFVRTVQSNGPGAWKNPADGFGTGCTGWGTLGDCTGTNNDVDFVFLLVGKTNTP